MIGEAYFRTAPALYPCAPVTRIPGPCALEIDACDAPGRRRGVRCGLPNFGDYALDPEIAARSIGNELRRFKGIKYRQEGRNWFLISRPETETAEGALESASAA